MKTRKLEINNFKNLGIGEKTTLILPPSDSGDLLFVIGENNVGKSNLLSAIKAFGDKSFQESDKPNFVGCEEANPSIKLIEKPIAFADTASASASTNASAGGGATSAKLDFSKLRPLSKEFKDKDFNISFTPDLLEEGARLKGFSQKEYIEYCRGLFDNANVLVFHDTDKSQKNPREEIRLVLRDLGFVLFCMTRAGKDLGCFRVMKVNDISEVKNIDRSFIANCRFWVEDTIESIQSKEPSITALDNANELKQFLKADFKKWQDKSVSGTNNLKNEIEECKENFVKISYKQNADKKAQNTIDRDATCQALSKKFSEISEIFSIDKGLKEAIHKWQEWKEYDKAKEYSHNSEIFSFRKTIDFFREAMSKWQKQKYDEVKFLQEITSFYDKLQKFVFSDIDWKADKYTDYNGYRIERRKYYVSENLSLLEQKIHYLEDICEANSDFVRYADKIAILQNKIDRLRHQYRDEISIDSNPFEDKYNELKEIFFPEVDSLMVYRQGSVGTDEISGDESFIPQVIWYEENQVKDSDLVTTPSDFTTSRFFQSLCKALGDTKVGRQINNPKYKDDTSYRVKLEKEINGYIEKIITKRFNELYQGGSKYTFGLRLETSSISLSFSKENTIEEPLTLSQQSTGFQWFFSFFFNFLHSHNLNSGDIVLLDELGGSLSIPTQRDLRKFLKDFAKSKHITFIAAIHTPYMIDINHLDEIRIIEQRISRNDNVKGKEVCGTEIINDFSAIDDEIDSLAKIRQAFGVDNHFSMVGGDSRIIFVEGITDYNYLTKFKLLYEKEKEEKLDIAFLPIGGLGKMKEGKQGLSNKQQEILDKLPKLARTHKEHHAILLVDNDKSGEAIKKHEKNNLKVISIDEAFEVQDTTQDKIKEIENLFSKNDIQKFLLDSSKEIIKRSNLSRWFKNSDTQVDKTTKDNFYKLLEYLKDL